MRDDLKNMDERRRLAAKLIMSDRLSDQVRGRLLHRQIVECTRQGYGAPPSSVISHNASGDRDLLASSEDKQPRFQFRSLRRVILELGISVFISALVLILLKLMGVL